MAWKPSQKALNRFDELVKKQNALRRKLLRRRAEVEKEASSMGSLPALIIPEKAVRSSRINWRKIKAKEFWNKIRTMNAVVTGGLEGWYKRNYKKPILQAWRDAIETVITEIYGDANVRPQQALGKNVIEGLYSKELMEKYSDLKDYMQMYNKLYRMSIGQFMYMYDRGYFPAFKYIYNEMKGSFMANYLDEMKYNIDNFTPTQKDLEQVKPKSEAKEKSLERAIKIRKTKESKES